MVIVQREIERVLDLRVLVIVQREIEREERGRGGD